MYLYLLLDSRSFLWAESARPSPVRLVRLVRPVGQARARAPSHKRRRKPLPGGALFEAQNDRGGFNNCGQQSQRGATPGGRARPDGNEVPARPEFAEWLTVIRWLDEYVCLRFHVQSIDKPTQITQTKTEQKTGKSGRFSQPAEEHCDRRKNMGRWPKKRNAKIKSKGLPF